MLEAAEQWHQTEVLRGQVFELTGQIVDPTHQLEEAQRRAKAAAACTAALEASAHENAAIVQAAAEAALISEVDGGNGLLPRHQALPWAPRPMAQPPQRTRPPRRAARHDARDLPPSRRAECPTRRDGACVRACASVRQYERAC